MHWNAAWSHDFDARPTSSVYQSPLPLPFYKYTSHLGATARNTASLPPKKENAKLYSDFATPKMSCILKLPIGNEHEVLHMNETWHFGCCKNTAFYIT